MVGKHQRVPAHPKVAAACPVVACSVLATHAGGRLYGGGRGRQGNISLGSREGGNGVGEGQPGLAWPETRCAGPAACLHWQTAAAPLVTSSGG
jgi:hypothetical protein